MTVKIGINGLGRIGRMIIRSLIENNNKKVEIKHINSRSNSEVVSSLLKYDSIHGKFNCEIKYGDNYLKLNGKKITFSQHSNLNEINWKKFGVDYVLECTGKFNSKEKLYTHIKNGAKKVIVSAPCKNADKTIVYGVNHKSISKKDLVISAASCTTNCLAPIAYVLNKEFKQTIFTSVSKPTWKIEIQNTKDFFELHSLKATQEENKGVFLLDEPIFRSYWDNKFKSTASSVNATLDLGEEKLLMTNNVHLTLTETDQKIDLFSEKINFDMRNKTFSSKNKVQIKNTSFNLNSNGFDLFQNSNGVNELIFTKAAFEENNASKDNFYGEADLIIYKSPSDTFTLKGSAEIKLESTSISAEEIEFNFKTKKIISSKKSKIIKS